MRLLVIAISVAWATAAAAATLQERMQFADGLYSRGLYDLALKEYDGFLREAPDDNANRDAALFRKGECHRRLGDRMAAEKAFRQVFVDFPKSEFRLRAGFRRAEVFLDAGQHAAAVDLFKSVIAEKPEDSLAGACWYYMGLAELRAGKKAEATAALEMVKKNYPASEFGSFALLELGELRARGEGAGDDDVRQALALFKAAAEGGQGTPRVRAEALFQITDLLFRRGDYEKSAEAFRTLLRQYPDDRRVADGRLTAAWAAHNAGLYAEGLTYATAALENAEVARRDEWLYLKANCQRQLGKGNEASATYEELLAAYPESDYAGAARYEQALTLYKMARFRDVLKTLETVKLNDTIKKDVYWLRAEAHAALNEQENAVQYYRLITRDFPKSDRAADAAYRLAHHLQLGEQWKEASRYYMQVAGDFPESELAPQAVFASGFCLDKAGLHAEAARDWAALIERYPKSKYVEDALYQKAMSEVFLERDATADTTLRDLLKQFPKTRFLGDAHYWLGLLAAKQEKWADAEKEYRAALNAKPRAELERETRFQLALTLRNTGKDGEASGIFNALLTSPLRDRFAPTLLHWLAEYGFENHRYQDAEAAARAIIEGQKDPSWQQTGLALLGRALLAQDRTDDAARAFRDALAQKVSTRFGAEAALRLGEIAMKADDAAKALDYYAEAARRASDESLLGVRARAYAGLGQAARAKGDLEGAARYFMSVAILYDDPVLVPACLRDAASVFGQLGRDEDQRKTLDELKRRYPDSKAVEAKEDAHP